ARREWQVRQDRVRGKGRLGARDADRVQEYSVAAIDREDDAYVVAVLLHVRRHRRAEEPLPAVEQLEQTQVRGDGAHAQTVRLSSDARERIADRQAEKTAARLARDRNREQRVLAKGLAVDEIDVADPAVLELDQLGELIRRPPSRGAPSQRRQNGEQGNRTARAPHESPRPRRGRLRDSIRPGQHWLPAIARRTPVAAYVSPASATDGGRSCTFRGGPAG